MFRYEFSILGPELVHPQLHICEKHDAKKQRNQAKHNSSIMLHGNKREQLISAFEGKPQLLAKVIFEYEQLKTMLVAYCNENSCCKWNSSGEMPHPGRCLTQSLSILSLSRRWAGGQGQPHFVLAACFSIWHSFSQVFPVLADWSIYRPNILRNSGAYDMASRNSAHSQLFIWDLSTLKYTNVEVGRSSEIRSPGVVAVLFSAFQRPLTVCKTQP